MPCPIPSGERAATSHGGAPRGRARFPETTTIQRDTRMKRRTFIQRLASTGIVLPIAMGFPRMRAFAKSPAGSPFMRLASSTNDHVLIMIRLAGGNDGLNTVVPYANSTYYSARKQGTPDDLSIPADQVVKLP